jgi:hypothetical protein
MAGFMKTGDQKSVRNSFAIAVLLLSVGCAEQGPRLFRATGTVSFNNKPIPKAKLVFHPQFDGPGWMPVAVVDDESTFQISTKQPGDGALPGRYIVTVVWHADPDDEDSPNLLPPRFADPKTSNLEVVVDPDSRELPPLQLTDHR